MSDTASQELPTGTVTFLFTDVEGSTKLWERAPDQAMVALAVHDKIIESHAMTNGGIVVRPRGEGDSRFVVFRQAKKALLAATAIQNAVYAETWETHQPLRIRIALHTGEADLRMGDYYGSAVNRCARIRSIAYGGQTLLSRTTWELVQDTAPSLAIFHDHGEHSLKDLARSEHIYELVVPGLPSDFPPLKSQPDEIPLEPPAFLEAEAEPKPADDGLFVARERELERLDEFLAKALAGRSQVVFISGEAGQGKSSLLDAFSRRAQAALPDLIVARGICDMYTGVGDPFLPFRDVLSMLTGDVESLWRAGNISRDHALRLWHLIPQAVQALTAVGEDLIDTLLPGKALVSRVSTVVDGEPAWKVRLRERIRRIEGVGGDHAPDQGRLIENYKAFLSTLAAHQPLLLILDDLHWADASSIALLAHLSRRLADSPILILGAYRPEDVALGLDGDAHPLTTILSEFKRYFGNIWVDLDEGSLDEVRHFVNVLLDTVPNRLDEDFRQAFATRTRGQALFAIELLRDMQERGDLQQDETGHWVAGPNLRLDSLPPRVEGVIETRIERLDPDLHELLSVASVEGESFTSEVVAKVLDVEERELIRRLNRELDKKHRLVKGLNVQGSGARRQSKYRFRHNLFQTYLYHQLEEIERIHLHESVGTALEQLYEGQFEGAVVKLARHFEQARLTEKAIEYRLQAGHWAGRNSALAEATSHYQKGLNLVEMLPDTPERANKELALQAPLGAALTATKGYTAKETKAAYSRAYELSRQVGHSAQVFHTLYGVWNFLFVGAELDKARKLAKEGLRLADQQQDSMPYLVAHNWMGITMAALGRLETARKHLEEALTLTTEIDIVDSYTSAVKIPCMRACAISH